MVSWLPGIVLSRGHELPGGARQERWAWDCGRMGFQLGPPCLPLGPGSPSVRGVCVIKGQRVQSSRESTALEFTLVCPLPALGGPGQVSGPWSQLLHLGRGADVRLKGADVGVVLGVASGPQ